MTFTYSKQKHNFGKKEAFVRLTYKNGKVLEPLREHYAKLNRTGLKSATLVNDGKALYTLDIKNDKLVYRIRSFVRGVAGQGNVFGFNNPKRCFMLGTAGKVVFLWDSGEVKEFDDWQAPPYDTPELSEAEK